MACLYQIEFPSGKSYIGISAGTAEARFAEHRYNSDTGRADRTVNRALRKYGADGVTLRTLVIAEWDYLLDLEKKAIAAYGTFGAGGYNMTAGGEGALGYRHTAEALKKMGDTHRGKARHTTPHTAESRAKMSVAAMGRKRSPESIAKSAAALVGNKYCAGKTLSPERRQRISEANKGRKWTDEQRARMSVAATKREADRRARSV
jgi:group I intron endonuclease